MSDRKFPRHTPTKDSMIKRLYALLERQIGEMEARYEARDARIKSLREGQKELREALAAFEETKLSPVAPARIISAHPRTGARDHDEWSGGETGLAGRRARRTGTGHPRKS
jgi:hypothetical protein